MRRKKAFALHESSSTVLVVDLNRPPPPSSLLLCSPDGRENLLLEDHAIATGNDAPNEKLAAARIASRIVSLEYQGFSCFATRDDNRLGGRAVLFVLRDDPVVAGGNRRDHRLSPSVRYPGKAERGVVGDMEFDRNASQYAFAFRIPNLDE